MGEARRGDRLIAVVVGLCLSLGGAVLFAQDPPEGGFVASKATRIYHKPSCEAVKRITARNKVTLASVDEANLQKFKPCPICKPNAGDAPGTGGDDEKTDGDMPARGKTKKSPARGSAKKAPPDADEKPEGTLPTKARGKRGNAKAAMKKGDAGKKSDAAEAAPADEKAIKFSRDIAPILVGNCTGCHNPQRKRGQFDMTTFEKLMKGSSKNKVISPGKPDESLLILKVRGEQPSGQKMPPGAQRNLAPETIAKLEDWVKAGARLDAGFEPTATLESIAPTPESRRRAELAKMSPEERDKQLEAVGLERWKKASAKTTPVVTTGRNFILFSNLPRDRADRLLKTMEVQRTTLGNILGPTAVALSGIEKISLFVFNDVPSYVEFVRSVENREVETGIEGHGRLDVEQPYVAVADPLNGAEESAASIAASTPGATKKSGKTKKARAASEDLHDGPDRTLAGLVSEHLAAAAANSAGQPPRWLSAGLGAFLAYKVDPKGSPYYRKLREETLAQVNLGWDTKGSELLGGEGNPETIRAVGFSLCEWMSSSVTPQQFSLFIRGMLEGTDKLDTVIQRCFGLDATRTQFLNLWGGFVQARYGGGRRR